MSEPSTKGRERNGENKKSKASGNEWIFKLPQVTETEREGKKIKELVELDGWRWIWTLESEEEKRQSWWADGSRRLPRLIFAYRHISKPLTAVTIKKRS